MPSRRDRRARSRPSRGVRHRRPGLPAANRLVSPDGGLRTVFLAFGPTMVELIKFADPQLVQDRLGDRVAAIDHVALQVADQQGAVHALAAHGVNTVEAVPTTSPLGRMHFTRADTSAGVIWQSAGVGRWLTDAQGRLPRPAVRVTRVMERVGVGPIGAAEATRRRGRGDLEIPFGSGAAPTSSACTKGWPSAFPPAVARRWSTRIGSTSTVLERDDLGRMCRWPHTRRQRHRGLGDRAWRRAHRCEGTGSGRWSRPRP